MDIYVARQPIFDRHQNVYAYELLYRVNRQANVFSGSDADQASSNVMLNSFYSIGIENLTGGKKAFINFTENLLKQGVATLFPKDKLVVEVLENVVPEIEVVEQCKELKRKGYIIALDDFVFRQELGALIDLADIIKVDFIQSTPSEQKAMINRLKNGRIRFLAEKIESNTEFEHARDWGYSYFQGYFFSKPVIVSSNDISPLKINYLRLIQKLHRTEIDFDEVAQIVALDISLSYKLLRLVNSAAFGFRKKVESVHQALVIVGSEELKKWISLVALKGIGEDKPDELVRISLVRAKMAENLSKSIHHDQHKEELFLLGLFSTLDVLMSRPMEEVLREMPITDEIKIALVRKEGLFGWLLQLILNFEAAEWEHAVLIMKNLNISKAEAADAYLNAVQWTNSIDLG